MTHLAPADRAQLARMLGLLGSTFPGERDAAGLAAHRLITARGHTWQELVAPNSSPRPEPHPKPDGSGGWRSSVRACLRHPKHLTRWEVKFLQGPAEFPRASDKQSGILDKIVVRLRSVGCEVA